VIIRVVPVSEPYTAQIEPRKGYPRWATMRPRPGYPAFGPEDRRSRSR